MDGAAAAAAARQRIAKEFQLNETFLPPLPAFVFSSPGSFLPADGSFDRRPTGNPGHPSIERPPGRSKWINKRANEVNGIRFAAAQRTAGHPPGM